MTQPVAAHAPSKAGELFKALGWVALFVFVGFSLTTLLAIAYVSLTLPPGHRLSMLDHPGLDSLLLQSVTTIAGFGLASWLIGGVANRLTLRHVRWKGTGSPLVWFPVGLVLGIVPALVALGLSMIGGHASIAADSGTASEYLARLVPTMLVLAPAALSEEIIFRGVPQVLLSKRLGRAATVALLSIGFAAAHIKNPNVGAFALINIALAGLFLGAVFYLPGGIWTAFGAHLGWNATLAASDAPVSGLSFNLPWINYLPGSPDWVTGGAFGPEGGIVTTLAMGVGMIWVIRRLRREES
jgi:hypothetical protein